ncbi:MAG: hypothetical protein ACI9J3_003617 [Parvicellaceae bacterium]|jgi:hypothetical protein
MTRLILVLIILIPFFSFGQETSYFEYTDYRGDTIKLLTINDPTICDCVKKEYRNDDQKNICDKKYDYDFMSEEEQNEFNAHAQICRNPSLCDCAFADMKDRGLVKSCDNEYRRSWHSEIQRAEYLKEMKACTESDLSYPKLIAKANKELNICDCINIGSYAYKQQQECNEKFFDEENLTEKEIETNNILLQECITNNQFSIDPTLCECLEFSKSDDEFKKACAFKFNTNEMTPEELVDFEKANELCADLTFYRRLNVLVDSIQEIEGDSLNDDFEESSNLMHDFDQLLDGSMESPFGRSYENEWAESLTDAIEDMAVEEYTPDNAQKGDYGNLENDMNRIVNREARITICSCHQLKENQTHFIARCPNYFRIDLLSDAELSQLQKMQDKCPDTKVVKTICDCIEINEYDKTDSEKEKCKELLKPLSTMELIHYMNKEKTCD